MPKATEIVEVEEEVIVIEKSWFYTFLLDLHIFSFSVCGLTLESLGLCLDM